VSETFIEDYRYCTHELKRLEVYHMIVWNGERKSRIFFKLDYSAHFDLIDNFKFNDFRLNNFIALL